MVAALDSEDSDSKVSDSEVADLEKLDAAANKPRKTFSFGPLNLGGSTKSKPTAEQHAKNIRDVSATKKESIPDSEIELGFAEPDVVTPPKPVESEPAMMAEIDVDELRLEAIPAQRPKEDREFEEKSAAPDELNVDSPDDELRLSDPVERPEFLTHHFAISEATDSVGNSSKPDLLAPTSPTTTAADRFEERTHTEFRKPNHEPLDLPEREVSKLAETYSSEQDWFKEMLAFIPDAHLIAIWIGLAIVLTGQMVFMKWSIEYWSGDLTSRIIAFFMAATIAIPLTLFTLVWGSVCGSNVFQQTAEGNKVMSDWPAFEFFGWINHSLYYTIPLLISLVPAFVIYQITGSWAAGGFITSIIAVTGLFFIFPLLMLSTVYKQSWWNPHATPIWNSLNSCMAQWKRFFLRCGVLMLVAIIFLLFTLVPSVIATSIAATGMVFVGLVYFRLLGFVARDVYNQLGIHNSGGSGLQADGDEGIDLVRSVMKENSADRTQ